VPLSVVDASEKQALMLAREHDLPDRCPIWDELQMFWMDTDPNIFLESAARVCAQSKYSLPEIEQIFWNEVRPAVRFNLFRRRVNGQALRSAGCRNES
jgi:hypothetical protein